MNKYLWIVLALIVLAGLLFWQQSAEKAPFTGEPIKIGVLGPFSGFLAAYGEEERRGIMAAQREGIEFIFEDDKCEPAAAVSAFKKLIELDKVQYLIGPACGSPQEAVAPLVKDKDLLLFLPSAASRSLHQIAGGKIYHSQYALEDESKFIADKMYELGHKKVILISYQNAFSDVHVRSFKANFKGEIVGELSYQNETTDVTSELVKIRDTEADAIFVTDITFFFGQGTERLKQYDIDLPVFSQYAVELPAVRSMVEGVVYSFPGDLGEEGALFELSKIAADKLVESILDCKGEYACVRESFADSNDFNEEGVRQQSIVLKKIVNGKAVLFEE